MCADTDIHVHVNKVGCYVNESDGETIETHAK